MGEIREVYLDYAAATPVSQTVMEQMLPYFSTCFHNPSAPYARAREAARALERARARVASVLATRPATITFTAGATEANNLALASAEGRIVSCVTEHDSVRAYVEASGGTLVGCDPTGFVDLDALREAVTDEVGLVSLSLANGEIGTIQPLRKVAQLVSALRMERLGRSVMRPLYLHTDASQAAGAVSVNTSHLGCDMMTLSAAKIYGPKQVGLLWHADGVAVRPLVRGGGQEAGLRSGTENVAGAVGFAAALEEAEALRKAESARLRALGARLRARLAEGLDDIRFSGPSSPSTRLPGIVHVSVGGVEARRLVVALERRGVSVGTGSACAASKMRVSPVLEAIGLDTHFSAGSLRLSMGRDTDEADIDYAADSIISCVRAERERLRAH